MNGTHLTESIHGKNPSNTRKAWKLFSLKKNGELGPLFINKRQRIPIGEWMIAESHRTKGYSFRPGWHCCQYPKAPHLSLKNRIWKEVLIEEYGTLERPEYQGGTWYLANRLYVL